MSLEVVFMNDPDEAKVGLWSSSRSDDSGIYLEFIDYVNRPQVTHQDEFGVEFTGVEEPKRVIRISIGNLADALELAHLIEKTVKP